MSREDSFAIANELRCSASKDVSFMESPVTLSDDSTIEGRSVRHTEEAEGGHGRQLWADVRDAEGEGGGQWIATASPGGTEASNSPATVDAGNQATSTAAAGSCRCTLVTGWGVHDYCIYVYSVPYTCTCSSKFFVIQNFVNALKDHLKVNFRNKRFVMVCDEPTPTADPLQIFVRKSFATGSLIMKFTKIMFYKKFRALWYVALGVCTSLQTLHRCILVDVNNTAMTSCCGLKHGA